MNALRRVGKRSLWVGLGAAALLVAGCAEVPKGRTVLTGDQEVPAVTTNASGITDIGIALFKCPTVLSSNLCPAISGTVATNGIEATAAHIHQGAAGQNGPVIVPLVKTADRTWAVPPATTLTPAQLDAYYAGQLYVNVHSAAHPSGEIRAQLKP